MQFKGWTIPGPERPNTEQTCVLEASIAPGESLDAISGHYRIFQYKDGHRFSTDDLLVAGYGTAYAPAAGRVLDLGSGIGSVATIAAWRLQGAHFTTIEAQEASIALARKSVVLNGLESRFTLIHGDFRETEKWARSREMRFDLILGSPPYFPLTDGVLAQHPQKLACRFEVRGDVSDYCRVAAPLLAPGAMLALVFPIDPPHQLDRVWSGAMKSGLFVLRMRPVALKEGETPLLGLFLLARKEDFPPSVSAVPEAYWKDPVLTIRKRDGSVHPEYVAFKAMIGFPP